MTERTVKEFAKLEQVDERTVRRWIEKGAVQVRRTPGGGVRIVDTTSRAVIFRTSEDSSGHPSA